jgi:hypothetical protein
MSVRPKSLPPPVAQGSKEMSIPGFTADASIYKTHDGYLWTQAPADLVKDGEIVPQLDCISIGRGCMLCWWFDGPLVYQWQSKECGPPGGKGGLL